MDIDLVKRCIKNACISTTNEEIFGISNQHRIPVETDIRLCQEDSKICRNKQIKSFEMILRMIFAACWMGDRKEDTINKMTELIKHLA